MRTALPVWATALGVLAALWHLYALVFPPPLGGGPLKDTLGRDFASYHYAVQVAAAGGDPYDVAALSAAAQAEGTRRVVHPYFYPPPFLIAVSWALPLDLRTAHRVAFWLDEIFLLLAMLTLWTWWRPLGTAVPLAIAVWVGALAGIVYGHSLGQVNGLVLALTLAGLWQVDTRRPLLGGALLGTACMLKMSPALFVAWWLIQRRWRPVASALGTAVALSVATLPILGPARQLRFYTEILPAFGTGDYNGLLVKIGLFANHSLPNLADQLLPGDGHTLSAGARALSALAAILLLGVLGWGFRRRSQTLRGTAAQVAAIGLATLLIPVYTYEHHLMQALPAMVLISVALHRQWLPRWSAAALIPALIALCWPHGALKHLAVDTLRDSPPLAGWLVQEAKTGALLALLCAAICIAKEAENPVSQRRAGLQNSR